MNNVTIMTTDINTIGKLWVVYEIMDGVTAKIEFAGMCLFSQLHGVADARANPLFAQKFKFGQPTILRVTQFFQNKIDASPAYYKVIRENNLGYMMAQGRFMKSAPIICNETGEKWATIGEAAAAHMIGPGNLSNHLNHKAGFRSVKGRTYSRVGS